MKIDNVTFPPQKVSMKAKDETWGTSCVNAIIGRGSGGIYGGYTRKERMGIAYGLYDSEFDKNDFKYITDPYNVGDVFPANMQNYNIIRPKIDLLIGEESKRPFNFRVVQTNDEAVGQVQEKAKQMLIQYMLNTVKGQTEEGETPEFIQKYLKYEYKTVAEEVAENILNHLKEKLNLSEEFLKTFKDALSAGEEVLYGSIVNGEPFLERVNPMECEFDRDSYTDFIDEKEWFKRTWYMTATSIYDRFNDIMDEDDLDKLLEKHTSTSNRSSGPESPFKNVMYSENISSKFTDSFRTDDRPYDAIEVNHCVWRSFKKVGFLSSTDESGESMTDMVDESYKKLPGEEIEWDWITEVWEGYKIGEDLYIGIRPIPYQHQSVENLNDNRLPYTGVIYNNTNTYGKSLIEIMKPLQYMYMVLWYRLELALSRDKGKILTMDVTQIPKKYGFGIEKWLHYLTSIGVNFINPYEEGWDVPGREGGKASQFNQIGTQDLSMSNVISGYIELMMKIEEMIGEISGVSKQRQGAISQNELVGNVNRAVIQSSHITEPIFWKHNQCKRRCLNLLINIARHAYAESGKSKLQYILSDGSRTFLDIADDFIYSDFDIFVSDSTQELQNIEVIKSLLQPAMQNGASLLDAAYILTSTNMTMIKQKLAEVEEKKLKNEQAMLEQQDAVKKQQLELEAQIRSEENRIKEEDSIRKAETAIEVAMISASMNGQDTGTEEPQTDPFMEELERQKLALQQKKIDEDTNLKGRALSEAERKNRVAEQQKEQEIKIKRTAANRPVAKPKTK
jgi:hypothetical protein